MATGLESKGLSIPPIITPANKNINNGKAWQTYSSELRQKNIRKIRFIEILDSLDGKSIIEGMKLAPGGNIEIRVDENIIIISPIRKNYTESFKGTVKGKQSFEELENLCAIDR